MTEEQKRILREMAKDSQDIDRAINATTAFLPGQHVVYEPTREDGVVTSVNDHYVFVRFRGSLHENGVACRPADLWSEEEL